MDNSLMWYGWVDPLAGAIEWGTAGLVGWTLVAAVVGSALRCLRDPSGVPTRASDPFTTSRPSRRSDPVVTNTPVPAA